MHEAERASRAMRAVPSGHGEPVHPCTQIGGQLGSGGLSPGKDGAHLLGQAPAVPAKEQGTIRCLCTSSEGITAEPVEGRGDPGASALPRTFLSLPLCCRKSVLPPSQRCSLLNRYQMWVPCASH